MSGGLAVQRGDCPPVGHDGSLVRAHVEHRLDCDHHAGLEGHAFLGLAYVRYGRLFPEALADAMPAVLTRGAVALTSDVIFDSARQVAYLHPGPRHLDAHFERLLGS